MAAAVPALAEWHSAGAITSARAIPNGAEFQAGSARIRITAIDTAIVRVSVAPDGKFRDDFSWAVLPDARKATRTTLKETDSGWELSAGSIVVRIRKSPAGIAFVDSTGSVLAEDDPDHPMAWDGARLRVWKTLPEKEHFYGLGDKAGSFDHRGRSYTLWNFDNYFWQESSDPLYKSIPFFLAAQPGEAYGIFFDNTYRSSFDFGQEMPDVYSFGAEGGELNYYFLAGPQPKQVLQEYADLTGRMPLPPLWTLGYQQSRYSYFPESRVRELARTFREKKIPADVIYLDIDYLDGFRSFTIDRNKFPHFEAMIADLAQQGFKVVTIIDPGIKKDPGYFVYDQGMERDAFIHNPDGALFEGEVWPKISVFPDFAGVATREWWGGLYQGLVRMGVRGFWNDMNEPAVFHQPGKTMRADAVDHVDRRTIDQRQFHNLYGMQMARGTFEGLRKLKPDERPFVLTRAAYAGAQRYAATWTGDNTSSWNHMRISVRTLLNLGLSGYAFVGDDIGGFIGSPTPELLTRWMELGALNPIYRNHTEKGTADQEPWVHGPEQEAIRRRYIELRYRLLPYLYTSFEQASRDGLPIMRPLFLEFPEEEDLYTNDQEFLLGRDILVAPKLMEKLDAFPVVLPGSAASSWYDYWTGQKFAGGESLSVNPELDLLPLYVRGGAFLPEQSVVQNTEEKPDGQLVLRVYPGGDCHGSEYLDDGKSYGYRKGAYFRVKFGCKATDGSVVITASSREGSFSPWWNSIELEIFGAEKKPSEVYVGGKTTTEWTYDAQHKAVTLTIPDSASGWEVAVAY
ncbi:MAG: glycoside hydrolase family 31 protein [Candidatus Acidiferrales bacterium]